MAPTPAVGWADARPRALLGFVSLTVYFSFENLGIARTSAFINLTPVVAVAGAYLLLGERFTAAQAVAAAVVVAGVWLANSGTRSAAAEGVQPRSPSAG